MNTARTILVSVLVVLLIAILGGLAGWYFFLYHPQTAAQAQDTARGLGIDLSFLGGSTDRNVNAIVGDTSATSSGSTGSTVGKSSSALWQVDKSPVAGVRFVGTASSSALIYVARVGGFVFRADTVARATTRLTETLTPRVYEALIVSDKSVIQRTLDDTGTIVTTLGTVTASTSRATSTPTATTQNILATSPLARDILRAAINPTTQTLWYLVRNTNGGADAMLLSLKDRAPRKVLSSPIARWTPMVLADGRLVLASAPADDLLGSAYTVASNGTMSLIIGNVPGLTILPHGSSQALIYGSSSGGTITLYARSATSTAATALPIRTIADKCVWSTGKTSIAYCAVPTQIPSGSFINEWYRGAVHTADAWWRVDVSAGTADKVYSPVDAGINLDVSYPTISPDGTLIAFINTTDQSLWTLTIPQ